MIPTHPRLPSPLLSMPKSSPRVPGKNNYSVRFIPSPHLPLKPKTKETSLNQKVFVQAEVLGQKPKISSEIKHPLCPLPSAVKLICQNHIITMRKSKWGQCTTSDNSMFLEPQRCIVFAWPQTPWTQKTPGAAQTPNQGLLLSVPWSASNTWGSWACVLEGPAHVKLSFSRAPWDKVWRARCLLVRWSRKHW